MYKYVNIQRWDVITSDSAGYYIMFTAHPHNHTHEVSLLNVLLLHGILKSDDTLREEIKHHAAAKCVSDFPNSVS